MPCSEVFAPTMRLRPRHSNEPASTAVSGPIAEVAGTRSSRTHFTISVASAQRNVAGGLNEICVLLFSNTASSRTTSGASQPFASAIGGSGVAIAKPDVSATKHSEGGGGSVETVSCSTSAGVTAALPGPASGGRGRGSGISAVRDLRPASLPGLPVAIGGVPRSFTSCATAGVLPDGRCGRATSCAHAAGAATHRMASIEKRKRNPTGPTRPLYAIKRSAGRAQIP